MGNTFNTSSDSEHNEQVMNDIIDHTSADSSPEPDWEVNESVGTDPDYFAFRHFSMNNVDRDRKDELRVAMLDCTSNHGKLNLYTAFLNASPRRNKPMDFKEQPERTHRRTINVDGVQHKLLIEEMRMVTEEFSQYDNALYTELIRNSEIFLLCFAIDSKPSYRKALAMSDRIRRIRGEIDSKFAVAFVVIKCELRVRGAPGLLSRSEMVNTAKAHGASYVETSFVNRQNVDRAIELFAHGQDTEIVFADDEDEDVHDDADEIKVNDDVDSDDRAQLHETSG